MDYDADATAPAWIKFLYRTRGITDASSAEEREQASIVVEFLQRAVGFSAMGLSGKHFFMCVGPKDTGKTTFQETIRAVLGPEYAGEIQIDTLMRTETDLTAKADIADLQGMRFVSTSEVERGGKLAVARVKYLTGGSHIKTSRKYEHPFSFPPSHTIWMDTNEKPVIGNPHDAVWGRIQTVLFEYEIPANERRETFREELLREKNGIAGWVVQGAMKCFREGLNPPSEVLNATEAYRHECDRLSPFLAEHCEISPDRSEYWVGTNTLWEAYSLWANNTSESHMKKSDFEAQIARLGCQRKHSPDGSQRAWRGIRLLNGASDAS